MGPVQAAGLRRTKALTNATALADTAIDSAEPLATGRCGEAELHFAPGSRLAESYPSLGGPCLTDEVFFNPGP